MTLLFLAIGLVALVLGGDILVRGAVGLATRMGLSPLVIGLIVVGFGTSTPELVTSLNAALAGLPGIAVGNVVGSNTANILLILGIAAMLWPIAVARGTLKRDGLALGAATLAALAVALVGWLSRPVGLVLVLGLVAYLWIAYRLDKRDTAANEAAARAIAEIEGDPDEEALTPADEGPGLVRALAFTLGGIAITIFGAHFLVRAAVDIAASLGVSETVIGLTVVAVGTSLPEVVTSVMAALRRHTDIALGNIVGSNIFNILGILGVTALVHPFPVPPEIAAFDIWVMLAATIALGIMAFTGGRITRGEGAGLFAAWLGYTLWLALTA